MGQGPGKGRGVDVKPPARAEAISARIAKATGVPSLVEKLARLPGADLNSLLLLVFKERAKRTKAASVLRQFEKDRFVRPASTMARSLLEFDLLAASLLNDGWEFVELAPLAPFGAVATLTGLSQDWAIATVRGTEVVSDSTNVLAMEAALRLKKAGKNRARVTLAASQRLTRPQAYSDPAAQAHFRLFGLVSATLGSRRERTLDTDALRDQLAFYLRLLGRVEEIGLEVRDTEVALTDLVGGQEDQIEREVLAPLASDFTSVAFRLAPERDWGRNYYTKACFYISAARRDNARLELVDGGFTDWGEQLLSDRRVQLLISGIGADRLCSSFASPS